MKTTPTPLSIAWSIIALKRSKRMQRDATKRLFTVDEYYRMAEVGILTPEDRVELIDGEIIEMSPIGSRHLGCVNRATDLLTVTFRGRAVVSPHNPVLLNNYTEPQPDLALLKFRPDFYAGKTPAAEDALLVLEVSDTTFDYDHDVKLPRYAAAGVMEVWVENLEQEVLLVCRDPSGSTYQTKLTLQRTDSISVAAFPDIVFKVKDLVG
jgi:Uma2 family endonuclease